jgi:hypothetical protein
MDGTRSFRTLRRADHGERRTRTEAPGGSNDPGDPEGHARSLLERQEAFERTAAEIDAVLEVERQKRREAA